MRGLNLVFFLTTFHFATVSRRTGAGAGGRAKAQDLLLRTTWPMTAPVQPGWCSQQLHSPSLVTPLVALRQEVAC